MYPSDEDFRGDGKTSGLVIDDDGGFVVCMAPETFIAWQVTNACAGEKLTL